MTVLGDLKAPTEMPVFFVVFSFFCYLASMKTKVIRLAAGLAALLTVSINMGANADAANSTSTGNIAASSTQVQDTMVLGKLYFVNLKEGEQPVMTALRLYGDRCGTDAFNSKPCASEGIRSVFELSEWIEFYPQASVGSGIKVMVFKHRADQRFYLDNTLDDEVSGYILEYDLNKDPDKDETHHWGSFYLLPEEVDPGWYDFVFIYDNKVFATMLTRFYKEEEIFGLSDSALEELMSQSPS